MESLKTDVDIEEHPVVIRRRKRTRKDRTKNTLLTKTTRILSFLCCLAILFCIGTLYSPWTGIWGTRVGNLLLGSIGGAVTIPLVFLLYFIISKMTGRRILTPVRQISGTIFLFLCTTILLGLIDTTTASAPLCLTPGSMGKWISSTLLRSIGALGTLFTGLFFVTLSAFLYGFLDISREDVSIYMDKLRIKFRSFMLRHRKKDQLKLENEEEHGEFETGVTVEEQEFLIRSYRETEIETENNTVESGCQTETVEKEIIQKIDEESTTVFDMEEHREIFEETFPDAIDEITEEKIEPQTVTEKTIIDEKISDNVENDILDSDRSDNNEEEFFTGATFPPSLELFGPGEMPGKRNDPTLLKQKGMDIITALSNFGVEAILANTVEGPTVIQYQLQLAPGIKVSKISGLNKDIAVALAVPSLRVEAPIPNTSYVGIEIPNKKRRAVTLRSMLETSIFKNSELALPLPVGYRVDGTPMVIGLEELPHLLVAGTTGSGKSVFVTSCITALCYKRTPAELRLMLIDPKRVEMAIYERLPHVLAKPIVDPQKAIHALGWAVREMERRYEVFARAKVRQLSTYNERVIPKDRLPHIVIVVDELADLMFTASKEVEDFICRLAQMARATGIHLILATQRPSVNVVTGLIKANIPARAAFTLPSQTDSRTIINTTGAQQLLGKGDMLFTSTKNPRPVRIQSPFIDEDTSLDVINAMRRSFGDPEYVELEDQQNGKENGKVNHIDDDRLEEAINMVLQTGIASASRLQRQMRVGFTRAARLVDTMEQMGIVGPQEGSKPREIYVDEERADEIIEEYFH